MAQVYNSFAFWDSFGFRHSGFGLTFRAAPGWLIRARSEKKHKVSTLQTNFKVFLFRFAVRAVRRDSHLQLSTVISKSSCLALDSRRSRHSKSVDIAQVLKSSPLNIAQSGSTSLSSYVESRRAALSYVE